MLSVIPISIICVNFIHKFYFHPPFFLAFSTYKLSYVIFSAGFFLLFAVAGVFLYSREVKSSKRLALTAGFLLSLSLFIFYMSFDVYTYVDEKGIHINSASNIRAIDSYPWDEVESVTQLNMRGLPAQLEIVLEGDKKIVMNLHADWYAKRRAFYEVLREYEIPLDTMEN